MKSMTASGGNLIDFILNRKGALPRAVRESRDYDSAVRVRFLAVQWTVATIEVAAHSYPRIPWFIKGIRGFYCPGTARCDKITYTDRQ